MKSIEEIRDEVISLHPYKIVGRPETYDQYNQGWEDACYAMEEKLQAPSAPIKPEAAMTTNTFEFTDEERAKLRTLIPTKVVYPGDVIHKDDVIDRIEHIIVAKALEATNKIVLPSEEEISDLMFNGRVMERPDWQVAQDILLIIKSLNPSITFTELNHEK